MARPKGIEDSKTRLSKRKRKMFLDILAETGQVAKAAAAAGYRDVSFLQKIRRTDEEFAKAWEEALQDAGDILESEAIRRAQDGVNEDVYYQGKKVGKKKNYSDGLMQFLLKGAKPDKYKDRKEVDHKGGVAVGVALLPATAKDAGAWEREAAGVQASHDLNRITIDGESEVIDVEVESEVRPRELERK